MWPTSRFRHTKAQAELPDSCLLAGAVTGPDNAAGKPFRMRFL